MNNSTKIILLKILEIIEYTDDKEVFVKEFLESAQLQAVIGLISGLSSDQQDSIKNDLSANKENPGKIKEVLTAHFTVDQIQKAFEEATKNAVVDWMKEIDSAISDEQRQKLAALSQELNPTPPPAPSA